MVFVGQQVSAPGRADGSTDRRLQRRPRRADDRPHRRPLLARAPVPPSWIALGRAPGREHLGSRGDAGVGQLHRAPGLLHRLPGRPTRGFANNDLAVVLLDSPLLRPVREAAEGRLRRQALRQGEAARRGRFGLTGPGCGDFGTRRSAQAGAVVASNAPNFLLLPVPSKQKYGTVCSGDSGGAALLGTMVVGGPLDRRRRVRRPELRLPARHAGRAELPLARTSTSAAKRRPLDGALSVDSSCLVDLLRGYGVLTQSAPESCPSRSSSNEKSIRSPSEQTRRAGRSSCDDVPVEFVVVRRTRS